jgi:hypothetical protein
MRRWFISQGGQVHGPVPFQKLRDLASAGKLLSGDHVCPEGSNKWIRAGEVANLFGNAAAFPEGKLEAAKPRPIVVAQPVAAGRKRPTPPATPPQIETAYNTASATPLWATLLLTLPKPLLFGLFGGAGGLLGAMLIAEVLWAAVCPTTFKAPEPSLEMGAPSALKVYAGGRNWFHVKVARQAFKGPVQIVGQSGDTGLAIASEILGEDQEETDIEVQVGKLVPAGKRRVVVVASSLTSEEVNPVRSTLDVTVVALPVAALRLTVSPEVGILQGGISKFTVKLARAKPGDKIALHFKDVPRGISLPAIEVPDGQNEMEVVAAAARDAELGKATVVVQGRTVQQPEAAVADAEFRLDVLAPPTPPKMDILFVLDLTGSMDFAIKGIKDGILNLAKKLEDKQIDFRVGLVGFRDIEDDGEFPYPLLIGGQTFTTNLPAFRDKVGALKADGGGDDPESCLQGLVLAAQQPFRADVDRVLVLITDAPPKIHKRPGHMYPPYSMEEMIETLKKAQIQQVHTVVRSTDYSASYKKLHTAFKGAFFDIHEEQSRGDFASLLPKLGDEISENTNAAAPPVPKVTLAPSLPAGVTTAELPRARSDSTLKGVQSTDTYFASDRVQLMVAIALWTMVIAGAISIAILAGQRFYTRRNWLDIVDSNKALVGGVVAGAVGGCCGQGFFQLTSGSPAWEAASRITSWTLLGGLIGVGLAPFVPNLKLHRGLLGGLGGGFLGAVAFVLVSQAAEDALLGRWLGAAILGFCIGLMVALAELAFRRWWLEVRFGPREVRTFTLGHTQVNVGGDSRRATVLVAGAAPLALRYWVDQDRVYCENREAGATTKVEAGDCQAFGNVTVTVCSNATARQSGFTLRLSNSRDIALGEGMPLTVDDLPGLQPQGTDGIVALVSLRPTEPRVLVLRNRSRRPWAVREANGATSTVEPGLGVELKSGLRINFGAVEGEAVSVGRNR